MAKTLLNTLFVTTQGAYVRLVGDTVRVEVNGEKTFQGPLLHLSGLVLFEAFSISPALLHRCAEDGRDVTLLDFAGRFKCRIEGPVSGNVLLRKAQYDAQADPEQTLEIARTIVAAKLRNSRQTLLRGGREASADFAKHTLSKQAELLGNYLVSLPEQRTLDEIRGVEGQSAACYFSAFDSLITQQKEAFEFTVRSRRPPRDRVNALMSFLYALLTKDCVSAAEGVGLDPQFGFLHCLRPGRPALALDLMEEFRSYFADRLALSLINRKQILPEDFEIRPGDSVMMTEVGRKKILGAYQKRKAEEVEHPLLKQKTPVGLLPHLQARLLARYLRGDLPSYVPFRSS